MYLIIKIKCIFIRSNLITSKMFQVKIIWCKNGNCENCEEKKPIALAIVNQVLETKDIDTNEQNLSKGNYILKNRNYLNMF